MRAARKDAGQQTGVRYNVIRQHQRHVLVVTVAHTMDDKKRLRKNSEHASHSPHANRASHQTVAVVPEVVLLVEVLQRQLSVLSTQDDLVPQHHLVDGVRLRLVLGRQVNEQLLDVPVEKRRQVRLQVEREEAEVEFVVRHTVVGDAFSVRV